MQLVVRCRFMVNKTNSSLVTEIENALYSYVMNSKYPSIAKAGMMFFIAIGIGVLTMDYSMYFVGFSNIVSIVIVVKFVFYGILGLVAMFIGVAPLLGGHNKLEMYALKIDELVGKEVIKPKS